MNIIATELPNVIVNDGDSIYLWQSSFTLEEHLAFIFDLHPKNTIVHPYIRTSNVLPDWSMPYVADKSRSYVVLDGGYQWTIHTNAYLIVRHRSDIAYKGWSVVKERRREK